MKNIIKTTAVIASLFAGSAAIAQGGFVDQAGFINADTPRSQFLSQPKATNENATTDTAKSIERGVERIVPVTIFATDDTNAAGAYQGR